MFMYTEAKKILRLFTRYFKLNLSAQMEYRASFLVQVFGMALNNATFIFFWWLAFGVAGEYIAGYTFKDIMFIWAVTSSAFGLAHILFYNVHRISNLIITGELDTFLLQPVPVLPNILGAGTSVSAWGDMIYGVVLLAIVWGSSAKVWLIFLLATLLGAVIFTCVNILAHTLTFYIGNAEMIASTVFEFMISFSIYPDKIFTGIVRLLIYSLLPAAFISHIPLRLVNDFNIGTLCIWLAFAVGFLALSFVFFYRGLRKYESGNLIVTRM